jgi:hypothetical protein
MTESNALFYLLISQMYLMIANKNNPAFLSLLACFWIVLSIVASAT